MEGPQFSTLAESRMYRDQWGAHVIGMTNMPEAKLAREAELCYASVAMVTDYDCWHPDHDEVDVAQVIATLTGNGDKAKRMVAGLPALLGADRAPCPHGCDRALEMAIMTAPEKRDSALLAKLDAIAGRVSVNRLNGVDIARYLAFVGMVTGELPSGRRGQRRLGYRVADHRQFGGPRRSPVRCVGRCRGQPWQTRVAPDPTPRDLSVCRRHVEHADFRRRHPAFLCALLHRRDGVHAPVKQQPSYWASQASSSSGSWHS